MEYKYETLSISDRIGTFRYRKARSRIINGSQPWVFSRTACLGNDLYGIAGFKMPRLNIQKGRADLLLLKQREPERFPFAYRQMLNRQDIWPLIIEQEVQWWKAAVAPRFILMDSFSELTDQLFKDHTNHSCFCANYHDLKSEISHSPGFLSSGLLPTSELRNSYLALFKEFHEIWPTTRIYFLNFPSHLETRELFLNRAERIREAIATIALSDSLLVPIEFTLTNIPEGSASTNEDWMPYHYEEWNYTEMAVQLRSVVELDG